MQLCIFVNLMNCIGQKFNVNVIKTVHRRSNFLKTLHLFHKNDSIGLKEKICFKIPRIFELENVICIFTKNLVNVAMRMEEAFYNISMYLYDKNVLEYAQMPRSGPKSIIRNIEGRSTLT